MRTLKYLGLTLVVVCLVAGSVVSCSSDDSTTTTQTPTESSTAATQPTTEAIELIMNFAEPESHPRWTGMIKPWLDEIVAKTNGKVKFITYFGNTLTNEANVWEGVKTGLSDLGQIYTDANPGKFPLTELMLLPAVGATESVYNTDALWKMYNEIPEVAAEYEGVKVLALFVGPQQKLLATKRVASTDDTDGVVTLVWSAAQGQACKNLGLTPADIAFSDMYISLEKGVLQGALGSAQMAVGTQIATQAKYGTDFPFGASTFYVIMNQEKYDSLPDDVKQVFDELSGEPIWKRFAQGTDDIELGAVDKYLAMGQGEVVKLSSDERAKWGTLTEPVVAEYIDGLEEQGLPGQEAYDVLKASLPQ